MKLKRMIALAAAACMVMSLPVFAGAPDTAGEQNVQAGESPAQPGGGESAGGPGGGPGGGMGMPPGGSAGKPSGYDAVTEVTSDTELDGVDMVSENGCENVVHVFDGASAVIRGGHFTNGGEGQGGDQASFYGVGATLFVSDGSLYVDNSEITGTTAGGTGIFAYDKGTAYVNHAVIRNSGSNSAGGIHVAGGGTLYAWDCDVETEGAASAAIRSDRGGGKMVIDGGRYYTMNGTAAVYCTADISIHNADLYAGASEPICIEGKNTIRMFDCVLEGIMQKSDVNDNRLWNCIVYQSMSGDSEVGTSEFDFINSKLICHGGPAILNTNTSSYITLKNSEIVFGDDTTYLLQVTGNSSSRTWGAAGKNGANCIFSMYGMDVERDVMYDTISNLDMYLLDDTEWEGSIFCDDTYNGGYSGDGITNVYIDKTSEWEVTGDSYISGTLYVEGKIEDAKVVGTDGTVYVDGKGFTVTVGGYEETADISGAGQVPEWKDYKVENPLK